MKIIFMGSPDLAVKPLKEIANEYEVTAVYTQPPKLAGRGKKERKTPVHIEAEKMDIPVFTSKSLRKGDEPEKFKKLARNADFGIVCAYGLILPKEVLYAPKNGCVNIHVSLLPRWRGAAPIQRAIEAGDKKTGVTIMQMDEGLDTGDILLTQETVITNDMNAGELHDKLSEIGAFLIKTYLNNYKGIKPEKQLEQGMTYAKKIEKAEAKINWLETANIIHNKIRAFNPYPGAFFIHNNERVKVFESEIIIPDTPLQTTIKNKKAGTVLDDNLTILCGENSVLRLKVLQRPGKTKMQAKDFLLGYKIAQNDIL